MPLVYHTILVVETLLTEVGTKPLFGDTLKVII